MALWTDIIDPATATGYARAALADYEAAKGTLARWLPNRTAPDVNVRFVKGNSGLVDVADFRAYDAEPSIGATTPVKRVTLELPALGRKISVSEYNQIRARSADGDAQALAAIQGTLDSVVRSVSDRMEHLRGVVLATGRATIPELSSDDDFGRPVGHQLVAANLWTTASVSRLDYLTLICDVYKDTTGELPGSIVMSTRILRAMAAGTEFQTQLQNGGARPATQQQVQDTVTGAGLPTIYTYDRRVRVAGVPTKALPDDTLLLLPAAVDPNDFNGTDLGATFWGQTLTSTAADWAIPVADQPGIVAGVYRNETPPMIAEVISDAIGLPVLANADRSLAAKVL